MDYTPYILFGMGSIFTIATGITGWFSKSLWDAVNTLKNDLNLLKIEIGTNYVRYDRLKDAMEPIMSALAEIKETLKTKADK